MTTLRLPRASELHYDIALLARGSWIPQVVDTQVNSCGFAGVIYVVPHYGAELAQENRKGWGSSQTTGVRHNAEEHRSCAGRVGRRVRWGCGGRIASAQRHQVAKLRAGRCFRGAAEVGGEMKRIEF
jgi:hypothetical protein